MAKGRPTKYTDKLSDIICSKLADGVSMRTICKDKSMPCRATLFNWLRTNEDFLDQYTRAKQESADALVDDIVSIADEDVGNPLVVEGVAVMDAYGVPVMIKDKPAVDHAKLRIDTRKWAASKLKPKKYGERTKLVTDDGKGNDAPINTPTYDMSKISDEMLQAMKEAQIKDAD